MTMWEGINPKTGYFSTHILTRRMTNMAKPDGCTYPFQLTSSQGGWQNPAKIPLVRKLFNSHPHKEDDQDFFAYRKYKSFQLTSSQGGWRLLHSLLFYHHLFNSHPHKEDDTSATVHYLHTHFSTHILTRRMTVSFERTDVEETFQLTSSQGGWQRLARTGSTTVFFNSHPHKEDDVITTCDWRCICFSTHILTRRMTGDGTTQYVLRTFQLTSSQGGWQYIVVIFVHVIIFQLTSSQGGWRILLPR